MRLIANTKWFSRVVLIGKIFHDFELDFSMPNHFAFLKKKKKEYFLRLISVYVHFSIMLRCKVSVEK